MLNVLVSMSKNLKARTNMDNTALQKQGTRRNLPRSRLSLDKGVPLEQSPRDSMDYGQNSLATCREACKSPRYV